MDFSFNGIKDGVVGGVKSVNKNLVQKPFSKVKDFSKTQANKMASEPDMPDTFDVIIIGGGLSGMNAAIRSTQQKLKTLFISGEHKGGKLNQLGETSNWPGYPNTSGEDLSKMFQAHIKKLSQDNTNFDLWLREEKVTSVKQNDKKEFMVVTDKKDSTYTSKSVICATGCQPNLLEVSGEEKAKEFQHGLVFAQTVNPQLCVEKKVIVLGNGEDAMNLSFRLSKFASNVTLITKDDELWGNDDLAKKLKDANHIDVKTKTKVKEILLKNDYVSGVKIEENGGNASDFDGDIIVEVLGDKANVGFLKDLKLDQEDNGAVKVDENKKSSIDGLFAVGDCSNTHRHALVSTAADGEIASLKAFEFIIKS